MLSCACFKYKFCAPLSARSQLEELVVCQQASKFVLAIERARERESESELANKLEGAANGGEGATSK